MVNKEDVEREWRSYAPGSRPWNMTPDLLGSGDASDGFPGMQGNRNELVGNILGQGIVSGFDFTVPSAGTVQVASGIVLIFDTAIGRYVVVEHAGPTDVTGLVSGSTVYAECNLGVIGFGHSLNPPVGAVHICVYYSGLLIDMRKNAMIRSPLFPGTTGFNQNMAVGGVDDSKKFRVVAQDGTDVLNVNTLTKTVEMYTGVEHVINADRLGGFQDFPDEPSPATTSYIPVADPAKTLQPNLNSDQLDGRDAGNASGNVPVSNGSVNTDLNADKVDGFNASGTPIASTLLALDGSSKYPLSTLPVHDHSTTGNGGTMSVARHIDMPVKSCIGLVGSTPYENFAGLSGVTYPHTNGCLRVVSSGLAVIGIVRIPDDVQADDAYIKAKVLREGAGAFTVSVYWGFSGSSGPPTLTSFPNGPGVYNPPSGAWAIVSHSIGNIQSHVNEELYIALDLSGTGQLEHSWLGYVSKR